MRLFNRRKEMEFDDPRLVGISLKTSEQEDFAPPQQQQQKQTAVNLPTLKEERSMTTEGLLTLRRSNTNATNKGAQLQPDKFRMTNASTWKRVARPWDSLRRSESSEHLSRSVTSSATNRRKTLHFYSEFEGKINEKSLLQFPPSGKICSPEQTTPSVMSSSSSFTSSTLTSPKRKIGRVESLRLLLSKSNKIYRGKIGNPNSKQDKGTDTQDLENDLENYNPDFSQDEFHSKYSSLSSLKSDGYFTPRRNNSRFQVITKTTSCENLNLLKSGNQGITLPGHRDMSTSTSTTNNFSSPFTDSCLSGSAETTAKRSSFPYAYIRSRLSSLQEEPKPLTSMSVRSARASNDPNKDEKQKCSQTNFMHKGFYHSMGNLLSDSSKEEEDEEGDGLEHCGDMDGGDVDDERDSPVQVGGRNSGSGGRIFDPLKQIRIDLLHRNPSESEIDDQSPSPTFWGRRSYSIGDILEKRKIGKVGENGAVEESGYDSDSTRNGHESPRNSVKSPSSETENELNESEQCVIASRRSVLEITEGENQQFDSQSQSNSESSCSSSSATSASMYSFPASRCLITINQMSMPREVSVNGFRKAEDGSIIEVTTEIDQTEDVDFYSATTEGTLESAITTTTINTGSSESRSNLKTEDSIPNSSQENLEAFSPLKSSSNVLVNGSSSESGIKTHFSRREPAVKSQCGGESKDKTTSPPSTTSVVSIKKDAVGVASDSGKTAPSLRLRNRVRDREWNSIKPNRSKSLCLSIFTVTFYKGPEKKSLGFSVIGGKDSPVPGIFVKRIFPYGQASEEGGLTEGDEILSVNNLPLANSTHAEALNIFKSIKAGDICLEIARREFLPSQSQTLKRQYSQLSSKSCEQLHQAY